MNKNNINNNFNLISNRLEKINNMLVKAIHIEPILDYEFELKIISSFTSKFAL